MQIRTLNREIFSWPSDHPARRFLEAFIECQERCGGREIGYVGSEVGPIDQEWRSELDGKSWEFSEFAYKFLCFDVVLDGWLSSATGLTESERFDLNRIVQMRRLMEECHEAARAAGNREILELVSMVEQMLNLWEACIHTRVKGT